MKETASKDNPKKINYFKLDSEYTEFNAFKNEVFSLIDRNASVPALSNNTDAVLEYYAEVLGIGTWKSLSETELKLIYETNPNSVIRMRFTYDKENDKYTQAIREFYIQLTDLRVDTTVQTNENVSMTYSADLTNEAVLKQIISGVKGDDGKSVSYDVSSDSITRASTLKAILTTAANPRRLLVSRLCWHSMWSAITPASFVPLRRL